MIGDAIPGVRRDNPAVEIAKADLLIAWGVLENLAVSFDQIGGVFGAVSGAPADSERRRALLEALGAYLTPELLRSINDARVRLGAYVPDEEAETLADRIPYWEYAESAGVGRRG